MEEGLTVAEALRHMPLAGDDALQIAGVLMAVAKSAAVEAPQGRHAQVYRGLNGGLHW